MQQNAAGIIAGVADICWLVAANDVDWTPQMNSQ